MVWRFFGGGAFKKKSPTYKKSRHSKCLAGRTVQWCQMKIMSFSINWASHELRYARRLTRFIRLYWKNTDIEADIFRKGTGLRFSLTWLVRIFMKIAKENFRSPRKFERLRRSVSQRANLKNSIARKKNRTHFKCDTFFPTFFPTLISAITRFL